MQSKRPMNTLDYSTLDRLPQQAAGLAVDSNCRSAGRMQKVNNTQAGLQRVGYCCCSCGCNCECKQQRLPTQIAADTWTDGQSDCGRGQENNSAQPQTAASYARLDGCCGKACSGNSKARQGFVAAAPSIASAEVSSQERLQTPLSHCQARSLTRILRRSPHYQEKLPICNQKVF